VHLPIDLGQVVAASAAPVGNPRPGEVDAAAAPVDRLDMSAISARGGVDDDGAAIKAVATPIEF